VKQPLPQNPDPAREKAIEAPDGLDPRPYIIFPYRNLLIHM
jgi:hypothetical protein